MYTYIIIQTCTDSFFLYSTFGLASVLLTCYSLQMRVITGQFGAQAPIMVPDKSVTMCQVCSAVFTFTFRRHHCRGCGKVGGRQGRRERERGRALFKALAVLFLFLILFPSLLRYPSSLLSSLAPSPPPPLPPLSLQVVCGNCSQWKTYLPYLKRFERVCEKCNYISKSGTSVCFAAKWEII